MAGQKIHVIGTDEIVVLLGLLGIEGTIIEDSYQFLSVFNKLKNNDSIGMIIIAVPIPNDLVDFVIEFKLNNRTPFIFCLPDIFQVNIENEDPFYRKILDSIGKIIT